MNDLTLKRKSADVNTGEHTLKYKICIGVKFVQVCGDNFMAESIVFL